MSGWKLWTSIASGVLSVGGGSTYYLWNRPSAADTPQVAAANPEVPSPHAAPPEPIPDPSTDLPRSQFVAPASFNEPRSAATVVRGNDGGSAFPVRPSFAATPDDSRSSRIVADASIADASVADSPAADEVASSSATTPESMQPPADSTALDAPPAEPAPVELPPASAYGVQEQTATVAVPDASTSSGEAAARPEAPRASPSQPNRFTEPPGANRSEGSLRSNLDSRSVESRGPPATLSDRETAPVEPAAPRRSPGTRSPAPSARETRLTLNTPGERRWEGPQSPSLTIERSAPEEIQVGKATKFTIKLRNIGQAAAQGVVVSDQVPNGTRFLAATPEATLSADGTLAWDIGTLEPNEDAILTVELMPEAEGEIGSVAAVTFSVQAAVRTIATKPLLKVELAGPAKVLIGEDVPFQISVSNPGTGAATGVVVEVDVPPGLVHDGGREIMTDPFDLRPNETRNFDLVLRAVQAGVVANVVRAVAGETLSAANRAQLEVIAPQLQLGSVGPARRFLDRPVKYQIVLSNPGTAPATQIELVAHLPRGLKFTAADKKGQYDPQTHAVSWSLEELPAGEQGLVELTAVPTDIGEQKVHIEGRAALGLKHQHEHITVVEDITDLVFTVTDDNVPIEIGSETTYEIRVANNGTKVARNIRLAVKVPNGLEIVDSSGPTKIQQQGDQLAMQAIAELGQREEAVFRLVAKGTRAGDHVLRVQLLSDEFSTPVTKEEITKVYSDK